MKKSALIILICILFNNLSSQDTNFLIVKGISFSCYINKDKFTQITQYIPYSMSVTVKVINQFSDMNMLWGISTSYLSANNKKKYGYFMLEIGENRYPLCVYGDEARLFVLTPFDTIDYSCCDIHSCTKNVDFLKKYAIKKDTEKLPSLSEFSIVYYPIPSDYPNIFNTFNLSLPAKIKIIDYCPIQYTINGDTEILWFEYNPDE